MGLSYYYTFSAPKSISAAELESFLKTVECKVRSMGFMPTIVINGSFSTNEQKAFVRRITGGLHVISPHLKGITLLDTSRVWDYDPEHGECRVIPEKGVLLVITDERGCETAFGFLWYPDALSDANGKKLAEVPHKGHWFFHDFVDTPDKRYREIVKIFADAGYLQSATDEYVVK